MNYYPNDTVHVRIFVGQTGLTSGSFTKALANEGIASSNTITVTEESGGWYWISFLLDLLGTWSLRISYGDYYFAGNFICKTHVLNESMTSFVVSKTVGDYMNRIKKYVANRLKISSPNYEVYEDDGSTIFEIGTISTTERTPP